MNKSQNFPVLVERETDQRHKLDQSVPFVVGRSQNVSLPVFDAKCSRRHFQIVFRNQSFYVEPLSENGLTYCNGTPIRAAQAISHGHVIQAGSSLFVFTEWEDPNLPKGTLVDTPTRVTLPGDDFSHAIEQKTVIGTSSSGTVALPIQNYPIQPQMLIGREEQRVNVHLPHSQVSRLHAQISVQGRDVWLTDLNSANGTFVNGRRITGAVVIKPGARIDIGPYELQFDGKALRANSRVNNVDLSCTGLTRVVKDREKGGMKTLLHDINLQIPAKSFVCLLGPSGSGKSTLLSALSARVPADQGHVLVNKKDLYANFDALKHDIAVVHQKDLMHEFLDVETVLKYTARLRLPPDTSSREIDAMVSEMLETVELTKFARMPIRKLSGGQLKRASLANEIISKPSLLFLDEVTSGLDEQTDAHLMKLFQQIAQSGKTVVCVTHSTANVEEYCTHIVVLTEGGMLAFVGTPKEVLSYFKINRLGEIYQHLKLENGPRLQAAYAQYCQGKPGYMGAVKARGPGSQQAFDQPIDAQVVEPQTLYSTPGKQNATAPGRPQPTAASSSLQGVEPTTPLSLAQRAQLIWRQTCLLTQRYLKIQLTDQKSLLMTLGQCILVGLFMVLLFGNIAEDDPEANVLRPRRSAEILFLMGISAFWFGCNNAAKEIVKEKVIYTRERDINLLVTSYLASKIVLLGAISFIQSVLLYVIVTNGTSIDHSLSQFFLVLTLSIAGVGMGLLISALSQSTDMAVTIVPLVLIPQIIFSGMIGKIEGLSQLVSQLFVVVYWGHGGLVSTLPAEMSERAGYQDWSFGQAWFVVALHASLYFVGALVVMHLASIREAAYGMAIQKLLKAAKLKAGLSS